WTSVERFYSISSSLKAANRKTIRNLQQGVIRDVLHRVRRRLPISMKLLRDIIKFDPSILAIAPLVPFRMIKEQLRNRVKVVSDQ
ncbi:MAG: hypothetical protein LM514_00925, partial [Streptococcus sp.]|nr:hypothetical protein [Streptococcus sp.]